MWQEQGKMMSGEQRFRVRFWGVRGSYPTPGPHTVRHGGNTSCVEMQVGKHTLIFDAGSGIVRLGAELQQRPKGELLYASLFITHGHGDHLLGFPFFAPLFDPHAHIHIFGPQLCGQNIEQLVTPLMSPPYFPVDVRHLPSKRAYHTIVDEKRLVWMNGKPMLDGTHSCLNSTSSERDVVVIARMTQSHPLDGSLNYRIEYAGRSVVYATDVEWEHGCEPEFVSFVEGADLLIHDAQYTMQDYKDKHGYGHCTVEMAVEAARAAHVGELVLFHHEPTYDDNQLDLMEQEARAGFARTRSACEGMEIDLLATNE
jgi:phosphoribosyl 1,2-cyclic phosphodiesterase